MSFISRRFIMLCLGLLACCHSYAQDNFYEQTPKVFDGSLILGANFSQVDGDTYYGFHKIGLHTGAQVYIHFTTRIGMTMDILYSQKGSRGEGIANSQYIGGYVTKYFMNLNYAEVPVTVHYREHGFDLEAGLAYAHLISSKEYLQTDLPIAIDPIKNSFATSDLEYVVGLGVKVYKKIYANLRYEYSIISIRPNDHIPANFGYGNNGQYNNLLNIRAIYTF